MLERGEITRKQLLTHRFEILFDELHVVRSSNDAQKIYETALSNGAFTMPNALETLTALYPHYALYLVTNGADKVQSRRIQLADMGKFFKNVFVSERFGVNKPRIEFFEKCFAQISDFKKEEAVIIGDSLTSDIKGGNIADIRTIWYNPLHKTNDIGVTVHHEIADLCELPPLLSSLSENFQD
jgi:2-haloacid dehalogenase